MFSMCICGKKQKIANYKYIYSSLKKYKPYYLSPIKNLNL
jgi:hypothetical protein